MSQAHTHYLLENESVLQRCLAQFSPISPLSASDHVVDRSKREVVMC
ncbi:MAG: hypothetical protein ACYDHY_05215 [Acidiferrobacterales bacterium]